MGKIISFLFTLFALFFFSGCATLLNNDGRQDVDVMVEDGREIPVIVIQKGAKRLEIIPAELSLKSENNEAVITNHPCFEPAFTQRLEKEFNKLALLDLFFYPSFIIDFLTEEMWSYEEPVVVPAGIYNPGCPEVYKKELALYGIKPDSDDEGLRQAIAPTNASFFPNYLEDLKPLSGLMITRYGGHADVTSSITDESGQKRVIANGFEHHDGYQIAFRNPTRQEHLYYAFVPRLMQHNITIADFREAIPTIAVEGKTRIDPIITDFYTGETVDPLDPNRYTIRLDAGGVDLIAGSGWDFNCDFGSRCALNLGLSAGVTLAEYQHIDLELGRDRAREDRWRTLNAYQGGINGYLIFPDMGNFFVEFGYMYMHYPEVDLPKKVEFKNTTRYNETKQIFERERVFVNKVELEISTFSFSMGVLF